MTTFKSLPVSCANCGCTWDAPLGASVTGSPGATVTVAAGAITATCPECGLVATNSSATSGTVVVSGLRIAVTQLGAMIRDLAARDRAELQALRRELQDVKSSGDEARAAEVLRGNGWLPSQPTRVEIWTIITMLVAILTMLKSNGDQTSVTPEQVNVVIVNVVNEVNAQQLGNEAGGH